MQIALLKTFVAVTWLLALAAFFVPADSSLASLATTGKLVLAGLALVHTLECLLFLPTLRRLEDPLPGQLLRTFVFGVSHMASVRQELDRRAADTVTP